MGRQAACKIRNTGIIAHIDAGKTTLSERILYYCQKIHKMGEVHDGAATMDFLPEEQERGITISSACTTCNWNSQQINLVDTPGHMDFTMEVERCLRVLDSAVAVFCAVGGVEPQSETVWRQADEYELPRLAFINKLDRQGASFERVLNDMRDKLKAKPVLLNLPDGESEQFSGLLDLLTQKKMLFDESDQGKTITRIDFSAKESEIADKWRNELEEIVAEVDDEFLGKWLEGNFNTEDLKAAIARATRRNLVVPVFCGSALRNIGVQPLLDGVCSFLPSPVTARETLAINPQGEKENINCNSAAGILGLIFKVEMSQGRKNCFLRLYSGTLEEGTQLINMRTGKIERCGRLYRVHADRRIQVEKLEAGDIALVSGLRNCQTGDTVASPQFKYMLEPPQNYPAVISFSLEPRNADEAKILDEALNRYSQEDPAFFFQLDEENGTRIISGMGELHLDVILERLGREYKIEPRKGNPQAALRETVSKDARKRAIFDREFGKDHQFGEVEVLVEQLPRAAGVEIVFSDEEETVSQENAKSRALWKGVIQEGIKAVLQSGPLAGWPVTDIQIKITYINYTDSRTTMPGLEMAASLALREAILNAGPVLLEPIMQVEISVPEEFLGASLQLLQQNNGKIEDIEDKEGLKKIRAVAPMRSLFGFATKLRSSTQGRAGYALSFRCHDVP